MKHHRKLLCIRLGEEAVDFSSGESAQSDDVVAAGGAGSKSIKPQLYAVEVDRSRDDLLTDFGKETLKDRYLLPANPTRTSSSASLRPMPTTPPTRSASTTISPSSGSCPPRRSCPNGGTGRGLRSAAI
jgi:ribonucleoside-diphosphate reductase alpha chain